MTSLAMSPEAFLQTVLPLAQDGLWDVVHEKCEERLRDMGEEAATLHVLGLAAFARNDLAGAAKAAGRGLETREQFAESSDLKALAHCMAGDINTALYFAKLTMTLPSREDLRAFQPAGLPTFASALSTVEENMLLNRAKMAMSLGKLDLSEKLLRQHLYFFPEDEDAMLLVALCMSTLRDHFGAAEWLRGTLHRRPNSGKLLTNLANELTNTGDFAEARAVHQRATEKAPIDAIIHGRRVHDLIDNPTASGEEMEALTRRWGERFAASAGEEVYQPAEAPVPMSVGVVLSDLPGTQAGDFLAQVLSRANPEEVRVVAYGYGTLTDVNNTGFQHAVSEWYDLTELDCETIADMYRAESLDVIIDAAGFTSPLSLAALGGRCAARQVLWRHAPYGAGLAAIDAQFTDATLDAAPLGPKPPGKLVTLRHGTVLTGLPKASLPLLETVDRQQITFGAHVSLRHLSAETASWWADALLAVPDSVLLLRDDRLSQTKAIERLTALFGNYGVAHRIDLVAAADGEAFWSQVDIALMPTRGGAPQRALNILWSGLPVLVPELPERANRAAASLFRHTGLDELVASSPAELARLAAEWAGDVARRKAFRDSIRARLSASPVFDAEARAQELWQACRQLFQ